jgi:hypothetical protein
VRLARPPCVVARPQTAGEAYQRAFHIVKQARPCASGRILAGDEDVIRPGDTVHGQEPPGSFLEAPAGAVPDNGAAHFSRGGESAPNGAFGGRTEAALDHQRAATLRHALGGAQERRPLPQAVNETVWNQIRSDARSRAIPQALSRLRPLARRRASTFRPFLVAMRARNPWRRLRFRLLGWKVRFVDTGHAPCSFTKGGQLARGPYRVKQQTRK